MKFLLPLIALLFLLGCGPDDETKTVYVTEVVYETEYETITEIVEVEVPCDCDETTQEPCVLPPEYEMPADVTIKDVKFWADMKGVSITRNDDNTTIYMGVKVDANATSILNSVMETQDPWFNFFTKK